MDHLAIMTKGYIDKILSGQKTIESRFSKNKITPFHKVNIGEKVYLQETGKNVTAMFEISKVIYYENLNENMIHKIKTEYGTQIAADDSFWQKKKASRYATLIFINNPIKITPFKTYKTDRSAFKTVNNIYEDMILEKRVIIKHPHDCTNNLHYFIKLDTTRCEFCNYIFPYSDLLKSYPSYEDVKRCLQISKWNKDWFSTNLDNIAKKKVDVSKIEIRNRLIKSIKIRYENDGRQTPYYGNPIYYAQHALGCCCRKCLEKFYDIPKDKVLDDNQINYFVYLIENYIKEKTQS